jgi:HlyD family secretion protein
MNKAALFIAALLLLFSGWHFGEQPRVNAAAPSSKIVFIMAGKVEAKEKAEITSKITAKVMAVKVDVGSAVKQGAPIVVLDTRDLEAQMEQAQAGVATAQANLLKVQSGARSEQITQAQAAVDSAKQNYELARINYQRMASLYQTEVISKLQLETSEGQLKAAEAQYISATKQLEMLNQGETPQTIAVMEAQVKQAQAGLNLVKTQLSNGVILAPISGVVSAKNINNGEMATVGLPLLSIVNVDSLYVNAYLPAGWVTKVKTGQPVIIKISEIPARQFQGAIVAISPVIDPKSRNTLVKVKLDDPDSLLKPGMFAEIGLKN